MLKAEIPFVKIEAKDHYEFGFKLGHSLSKKIKLRIAENIKNYKTHGAKNYPEIISFIKKFMPATKKRYPNLFLEANGIAEGAGVPFEDLFTVICEEEILDLRIPDYLCNEGSSIPHCTNVAIKTKENKILIGHNEDWLPEYCRNGLVIVKGKLKNNKFLSLGYLGSLPGTSCGLTSKGFAFTVNSLQFRKFRYEVPRGFQLAELLEIKDQKSIMKVLDFSKSSISGNTMLAWANSKILDVEELYKHNEKFSSNKWLIHTNHPLLKKDQDYTNTLKESVKRYNRAVEILIKEKHPNLSTIKKILSDHKAGICEHNQKKFWYVTIASAIINPTDKWMEICHKNPCRNKYKRYYL